MPFVHAMYRFTLYIVITVLFQNRRLSSQDVRGETKKLPSVQQLPENWTEFINITNPFATFLKRR